MQQNFYRLTVAAVEPFSIYICATAIILQYEDFFSLESNIRQSMQSLGTLLAKVKGGGQVKKEQVTGEADMVCVAQKIIENVLVPLITLYMLSFVTVSLCNV